MSFFRGSKVRTFEKKYRVFGPAYLESQSGYDLEKSDKLVLPSKALEALTNLGLDFPMTLRVTPVSTEIDVVAPKQSKQSKQSEQGQGFASLLSELGAIGSEEQKKETRVIKFEGRNDLDYIDKNSGVSLILSSVADFGGPDGMVTMSSWLIEKLGLSESGRSVVKLEAVTRMPPKGKSSNPNLAHLPKIPLLNYVEFQPFSLKLVACSNLSDLVVKTLNMYYSSLRRGDVISVWYNNEACKLEVKNIRGKDIDYIPKVVLIPENVKYEVGFSKAKDYEENLRRMAEQRQQAEQAARAEHEQKMRLQAQKRQNEAMAGHESDGNSSDEQWEIVKVGPFKNGGFERNESSEFDDLAAMYKEESFAKIDAVDADNADNADNANNANDADDPNEERKDEQDVFVESKVNDNINNLNKNDVGASGPEEKGKDLISPLRKDESDVDVDVVQDMKGMQDIYDDAEEMDEVVDMDGMDGMDVGDNDEYAVRKDDIWHCLTCKQDNLKMYAFCPGCGLPQDFKEQAATEDAKKKVDLKGCLQVVEVVNNNTYEPLETRNTGWELKNVSKHDVKVGATLRQTAGHGPKDGVEIVIGRPYTIEAKAGDNTFFFVNVKAPSIPGKYQQIFELRDENDCILCKKLKLDYQVNRVYNEKQEEKIAQIYNMGFTDRKKVATCLQRNKWNVDRAITNLLSG